MHNNGFFVFTCADMFCLLPKGRIFRHYWVHFNFRTHILLLVFRRNLKDVYRCFQHDRGDCRDVLLAKN